MLSKPNPFWHMFFWGFVSGLILALLYIVFFLSLGSMSLLETLLLLISPSSWYLALLAGGLPGAGLGILTGIFLWFLNRGFPEPFTREAMQKERKTVYTVIGSVTTIVGFMLITVFFGFPLLSQIWYLLILPPFIAGIAAAYAAHRYLFQLWLWNEQRFGIPVEKAKNTARLEDKAKNEEIDFEDQAEKRQEKSS